MGCMSSTQEGAKPRVEEGALPQAVPQKSHKELLANESVAGSSHPSTPTSPNAANLKEAPGVSNTNEHHSQDIDNKKTSTGQSTASAYSGLKSPNDTAHQDEEPKTSGPRKGSIGVALDPGMFITQQRAHFSDRYTRERKLGSGAYGEVLLCRDKSGNERAIKIIKKSSAAPTTNTSSLLEEVAVVKQLDHPNIMKLYEFFEDQRCYYLVMDVYKGGELFDEIINRQKFSEADAASITKQVLSGVYYLHKNQIVHRDLKPENLLLETKEPNALIKIVDFGLSAYFDPSKKMKDRLGTAYYIAPEVLKKKYDEKCDVWAIGVILYILLCGYPPFGGATDQEILRKVEKGKFTFDPPEWVTVSKDVKDLIRQMLVYDPVKRISAEAALRHKWIVDMCDLRSAPEGPALQNALGNMRKFHASQKLAQATLLFIGSKLTTMEETKELTQIFRSLDKNGDGQLDRKELVEGYVQLIKIRSGEETVMTAAQIEDEVDRILAVVDFDQNGCIDYSEFVTVAMDRETLVSRDRLRTAFNMFDIDLSGSIAADELRKLFDVTDDQWGQILSEVDKNNDGEVDFEEFVSMMQTLINK